jgi:hypothetical protein
MRTRHYGFSAAYSTSIAAMTPRIRWTIGLLLALVIGLAVGLVIVTGDESEETTVTVTGAVDTPQTEATQAPPIETETSPESGGVPSPDTGTAPDGSGGLGVSPPGR